MIIQGKSSCLTPYFLFESLIKKEEKEAVFDVVDCCAAPGNKTLQLSEYQPQGRIFAFEKDEKRCNLLKKRV